MAVGSAAYVEGRASLTWATLRWLTPLVVAVPLIWAIMTFCQAPRGMRMAGASSDCRGEDGPW